MRAQVPSPVTGVMSSFKRGRVLAQVKRGNSLDLLNSPQPTTPDASGTGRRAQGPAAWITLLEECTPR